MFLEYLLESSSKIIVPCQLIDFGRFTYFSSSPRYNLWKALPESIKKEPPIP
jgi:hypothetical protein